MQFVSAILSTLFIVNGHTLSEITVLKCNEYSVSVALTKNCPNIYLESSVCAERQLTPSKSASPHPFQNHLKSLLSNPSSSIQGS